VAETLGGVGEFDLIARIRDLVGAGPLVGVGDDAAVLAAPDGRVVATTDLLVEGRHFRLDWSTPYEVGRKAAAQNLADVCAMGARPTALLVGFGAPPSFPAEAALDVVRGLVDEARLCGAVVAGGDTVSSEHVVLAVTALGDLEGRTPVLRSGARPGDVLVVAGALGGAAAGLAALGAGRPDLAGLHRVPEPPYEWGPRLADLGATSMIDVSDGLTGDLAHVARASGVGFEVDVAALPRHDVVDEVSRALGVDGEAWVLGGGDDHALVATLPAAVGGLPVVGRVVEEPGIRWLGAGTVPASWEHFR
jgi:thiamine-monophosphate kinase